MRTRQDTFVVAVGLQEDGHRGQSARRNTVNTPQIRREHSREYVYPTKSQVARCPSMVVKKSTFTGISYNKICPTQLCIAQD